MYPLGLSGSDQQSYHDGLRSSYTLNTRVQILDMGHNPIADVSRMLYDGQVDIDQHGDVTRQLSVSFIDPRGNLPFDSDSPADGALYMDRMIRVWAETYLDTLNQWIHCPIFTGPVTSLNRSGEIVEAQAQGKEILGMGAAFHPHVIGKGEKVTTAIWRLLSDLYVGETLHDLGELGNRMSRALSIGRQDKPWAKALQLAHAINRQLFYDGYGRLRLRRFPKVPHITFDGRSVTSDMQVAASPITANVVDVTGGVPAKKKPPVHFTARAPGSSPVSPWKLGMPGYGRFLVEFDTNDQYRTVADARNYAQRRLDADLSMPVEATFNGLPFWHLEPADMGRVDTDQGALTFPLRQMSLPLVASDGNDASYGYLRDVRVRPRRRNR